MTAAEKLDARNILFESIEDVDAKLTALFAGKPSYRVVEECRELLDNRQALATTLLSLGGQPGPAPLSPADLKRLKA